MREHPPLRAEADIPALPPRTVEIARLIASGFLEKEIAAGYGVTRSVVGRERQRFCEETGAVSRRGIVLACRRHGIAPV